ncbi:unnamed protein product [Pleuronectes platessa]|uniref:Uncharacterized protein n=1 Tax=Pleuronectes platessa TaxID=8262 RepID=A0A9N7TSU2_PLEPL|nr:unnamed protein product [Pleuronectes platessa]
MASQSGFNSSTGPQANSRDVQIPNSTILVLTFPLFALVLFLFLFLFLFLLSLLLGDGEVFLAVLVKAQAELSGNSSHEPKQHRKKKSVRPLADQQLTVWTGDTRLIQQQQLDPLTCTRHGWTESSLVGIWVPDKLHYNSFFFLKSVRFSALSLMYGSVSLASCSLELPTCSYNESWQQHLR